MQDTDISQDFTVKAEEWEAGRDRRQEELQKTSGHRPLPCGCRRGQ